jgi:hypothetical protein
MGLGFSDDTLIGVLSGNARNVFTRLSFDATADQ